MDKITRENRHWTIWSYKVTDNGSSWGLYTANDAGPNKPNVNTESRPAPHAYCLQACGALTYCVPSAVSCPDAPSRLIPGSPGHLPVNHA